MLRVWFLLMKLIPYWHKNKQREKMLLIRMLLLMNFYKLLMVSKQSTILFLLLVQQITNKILNQLFLEDLKLLKLNILKTVREFNSSDNKSQNALKKNTYRFQGVNNFSNVFLSIQQDTALMTWIHLWIRLNLIDLIHLILLWWVL